MTLFAERVKLCDLLWGRQARRHALDVLGKALVAEAWGAPAEVVDEMLASAAHWEWIASITEKGQVLWGQRRNREGRTAEDIGVHL